MRMKEKPLSEFMIPIKRPVLQETGQIARIAKIDFQGNLHLTSEISKTRQFLIKPASIIFSKINAKNGAISFYEGEEPISSSAHYLAYSIRADRISPKLLMHIFQSDFFRFKLNQFQKSGIKTEISSRSLLKLSIPYVEERELQEEILQKIETKLQALKELESYLTRTILSVAGYKSSRLHHVFIEETSLKSSWQVKPLASIAALKVGRTPAREHFRSHGIPFIKVQHLINDKVSLDSTSHYINPDYVEQKLTQLLIQPGDLLLNIVGPPLGKLALIADNSPFLISNQAIARIRPFEKSMANWLFWYFKENSAIASLPIKGNAGQINLSIKQIAKLPIPFPAEDERLEIIEKLTNDFILLDRLVEQGQDILDHISQLKNKITRDCISQL